jgi:hypothetical protein
MVVLTLSIIRQRVLMCTLRRLSDSRSIRHL